jgi:small-conductance mechanosensitive channel
MILSRVPIVALVAALAALPAIPAAQAPAPPQPDPQGNLTATIAMAAQRAEVADSPATLVFTNRPIVRFRATVMARPPSARAAAATELLNGLVETTPQGRVTTRHYGSGVLVGIDDRPVFVVFDQDADPLAGETKESKAAEAAAHLQQAFSEAVELRTPGRLLSGIGFAAAATVLYLLLIWALIRLDRRFAAAAGRAAERRLREMPVGPFVEHFQAPLLLRRLVGLLGIVAGLFLTYSWLAAVLRRFPYTRPWGESLRSALLSGLATAGRNILDELPNLLTVLGIVLFTRFLARVVSGFFTAVERGTVTLPWVHQETAQPTRRIMVALLWLFALVVSYEYLPGAESDVFKGVSVFVGLVISLGSSGIMNQVMSGLMVTYSRALRQGDFVRIADVEGTVTHLGTLSTKVRTPRNEEITIPNAVVVSNATTNFSRHAERDGVFAPTSVTIGYDQPWRQVHALLLLAAERTKGVRQTPKPTVMQTALQDFYVQYTLLVCLDNPARRLPTLNELHANIQDAFNEYGVQIMSPNYEADPEGRKIVPRDRWYDAPAAPPSGPQPVMTAASGAAELEKN